MTPLVEARGIGIAGRLDPSNLQCASGELIALIGPNGAGKTSLLRALAGIELDAGAVVIEGEWPRSAPPARRMRLLSFLPATRSLVWPISTRDAIALGLPRADPARVEQLIELFELGPFADRAVSSLSTGERSRVLLARALAARARLLLLDEPLATLDPYWVLRILDLLRQCANDTACTVLASLHDLGLVDAFDRVLLVDSGRIVADGKPADVLGSDALVEVFGVEKDGERWRIRRPEDQQSSP
jgi:iron complex transport system ATP-binding protein